MQKLILMSLFLFSCSTFHKPGNYQREIASLQNSSNLELKLSQDLVFANGANSVMLRVAQKNKTEDSPQINPADLKLVTDVKVESGKFTLVDGAFQISIKPQVKSSDIKIMVIWKDKVSPFIKLKTTMAPMKDKMLPIKSDANESRYVSDLYYIRQDNFPAGQFEGFRLDNQGGNVIVSAENSQRSFDFDYDEQARQNISMMVTDAPNGTVSHTMHSLFLFFPRKVLPFAEIKNKEVTATLPNGEQMMFAESGEIKGGVFTEGPVDVGPDRFKRTYADLKYQGKGILLRANARGQMPQQGQFEATKIDMEYGIKFSADVLIINGTTGQRCRRPKIDFWPADDISPILFKFPTDKEFDVYLKAKCGFGIPETAEEVKPEEKDENIDELAAEVWSKCENSSDIKKCIQDESEIIEDESNRSKVRFILELKLLEAKAAEQLTIAEVLQKEVAIIRITLLAEATWVKSESCLDKSKALVKGSFQFHNIQNLIENSLVQNCSTIKEEMAKIAALETPPLKEKLEADFSWATVSNKERLIADCQKKAMTLITSDFRYHQTPALYSPSLQIICTSVESSEAFKGWILTQSAGLEEKILALVLLDIEVRGEKQALECLEEYPMDTQLNRMRFKKQREICLVDNWFSLEADAIKQAKRDP
ncbi:MAG: hypothetical protein H0V66_13440, partial [Bdellovibrionales bacterium]|nr:hypothetical protein [Bdellovibrionales bacterium]